MENPRIKIESNGVCTEVSLDGKKISCTQVDFHADVADGLHVEWEGIMHKLDKDGHMCIENNDIVTEKFHYDSHKAVVN